MSDGEEPVTEPTLQSLNADMRAQSSLLRELATAVAQLTARDRVVDGEGAHGSGSGQRFARQPTGSGGAAERPDLLELAQSGRVGAKSVSAEDDYLAVPELLQRAESGYEAVRPVSRVPGLFPLSTDLTNEYLKQDDRRLPAQEEYLWMSCFGAHMAALFVALDELLPYVPSSNQDFTPYLARARNHAEAIDKAFRFRLAFLRKLNEIKRVHAPRRPLLLEWRLQLQVAGVGEDVAGDVDVAAKDAFGSDELGQRTLDLLSSSLSAQTLKSYAGRLAQFAEFCHDSENISPLEATTATVVRYVAWIGERGHIAAKSLQPYLSAINTFFELHNLVPIAKDSLHLTSARPRSLQPARVRHHPADVLAFTEVAAAWLAKARAVLAERHRRRGARRAGGAGQSSVLPSPALPSVAAFRGVAAPPVVAPTPPEVGAPAGHPGSQASRARYPPPPTRPYPAGDGVGWGTVDHLSDVDMVHMPAEMSMETAVPIDFQEAWAEAQRCVNERVVAAMEANDPVVLDRALKWKYLLPQLLLRAPSRGGRRRLQALAWRFRAFAERRMTELVRSWDDARTEAFYAGHARQRRTDADLFAALLVGTADTVVALVEDGELS
eukprot:jgi/Tetstr1/426904/TSEL_017117.t1